jgi:hypothetical protein
MNNKDNCYKVTVTVAGELVKERASQLPYFIDGDSTAAIKLWRQQVSAVYIAMSDIESLEQQWAILKGAKA